MSSKKATVVPSAIGRWPLMNVEQYDRLPELTLPEQEVLVQIFAHWGGKGKKRSTKEFEKQACSSSLASERCAGFPGHQKMMLSNFHTRDFPRDA